MELGLRNRAAQIRPQVLSKENAKMGTMLRGLGINTRQFGRGIRHLPAFLRDYWQLRSSLKQ